MVHTRVGHSAVSWDDANRATFVLSAFALENAIKAFLVYEHPEWIAEGYLARDLRSHRLVQLSEMSTLIPYRKRDSWVLTAFEDGNESWMRYPCGLNADDIQQQRPLHDELWAGYNRVISGYGRKLIRLLGEGWKGPFGWMGSWDIKGQWLGAEAKALTPKPLPARFRRKDLEGNPKGPGPQTKQSRA